MERKQAHRLLFQRLPEIAPSRKLQDMESEVEQHLKLSLEEKEALAEPLSRRLAALAAETLGRKSR
jgi:hypothetical protein